jgi:peroxiredoxin
MFVCLTFLSTSFAQVLKEGDPAPQFELEDANGKMFKLNSCQGKVVIMGFMRKTGKKADGDKWMAENRRWLVELNKQFGKEGIIVGVFQANPPSYLRFAAKMKMRKAPIRAIPDWDGTVMKKYPSDSLFNLYVVNKEGLIVRIISEPFSAEGMNKLSSHIKDLINMEKK